MERPIHHLVHKGKYFFKSLISRVHHLSRRKRNRALFIFSVINLTLLFLVYSNLFVYPNTFLGNTDISGKTAGQIKKLLLSEQGVSPKIQVKDRTYQYGYDQLGIVVDQKHAIDEVFAPNRRIFPLNLFAFFQSIFTKHVSPPPLVFTQEYDQFVDDMVFNFSQTLDTVAVDPETKSLLVTENSQTYRFEKENLNNLLVSHFGNYNYPIYPLLAKVTNEILDQVGDVNQKLNNIFSSPIIVYLDLGGTTQAFEMKEEDIREVTSVILDPDRIHVHIDVHQDALNRVITRLVHAAGFPIRNNVVTQNVQGDFEKAVRLRFDGANIAAIATKLDDGANTDGTLAKKYIEVDISQQKMYLFADGKIYKSYKVSTGLDYPTPIGHFTILNKVGLGFSNIYNVWLPWWMGFAYSKELGAYFGIHEQPYTLTQDGKPVIRGPQIGSPSTGGCVALAPGAAQQVYWFADVGTQVYIYQ